VSGTSCALFARSSANRKKLSIAALSQTLPDRLIEMRRQNYGRNRGVGFTKSIRGPCRKRFLIAKLSYFARFKTHAVNQKSAKQKSLSSA
jgi:hypothetical protein